MVTVTPKAPADPDVKLPPSVRAAAERANEIQRQVYGEQPPPADQAPAPAPAPVPAPATNGEDVTPQVTPTHPIESVPETPAPVPPSDEDESWEKRYKAMKGRYDKEVPRLKQQIDTLVDDVTNLRGVLATMEVKQPTTDQTISRAPKKLITAEEEADYGEEFFTVVEKKARELIEPIVEQYDARYKALEQRINGVGTQVVQSSVERMERELDQQVPDWRTVNADWEDNGFKEWLQLPDPYSGAIRHQLMKAAYERCDTPRVAAFFKGFHAEVAATDPAGGDPNLAPTTVAPKVSLTALAAPGRAKSAAQQLPAEKPILTRAQIKAFYDDVAAGRYRGQEAKQAQDERIIFEAQREGRIRP